MVQAWRCDKCSHVWLADSKPRRCSKCKSSTWDAGVLDELREAVRAIQEKPAVAPVVTPVSVTRPSVTLPVANYSRSYAHNPRECKVYRCGLCASAKP